RRHALGKFFFARRDSRHHARRKPRPFFLAQAGGALKELLRPKNLQDRARAVLAGCHVRPLVRRQRFGQVFDTHGIGLLRRCLLDRATEPSTFLFTSLQQVPHIGLLAWPLSIFSVSLRSCLAHYAPPCPKEPDLHSIGIQLQDVRNLLNRKPRFDDHLLRDASPVLAPPYNPPGYGKYAMLLPPDELLKRLLALPRRPPHQFAVVGSLDRRNTASRPLGLGSTQGLWFWDVCHGFLVTPNISGLTSPASSVSFGS